MNFIKFKPIYCERVWGGRAFASEFGRTLPGSAPIGESWEISDRPEANSKIDGGRFDGLTLREAVIKDCPYVMGPSWKAEKPFPILVKWLDAAQHLSVQVHPQSGSETKNENWYIAKCAKGAKLVAGLKAGTAKETFAAAVAEGAVESLLNAFNVAAGDSVFIPNGLAHAICAGNLILEIQRNSDTTYRVFDWNRVGLDGKPRTLHIEESLREIDFGAPAPEVVKTNSPEAEICRCKDFRLSVMNLKDGQKLRFNAGEQPRILSVAEGGLKSSCGGIVRISESVVLPFAQAQEFEAVGAAKILLTDNFS